MFLGQLFVENATKNDPKTLLNGPNRRKYENSENVELPRNSVKNGRIRPSKCHQLVIFY